ncbi:MAG: Maf family protein [Oscillospiraceae bacterium]|nr:Maf family protein [Oscillospiraceae bacterium]
MADFILASASPRRRELLKNAGFDFEVAVSGADERLTEPLSPREMVTELACRKAHFVSRENPGRVVLGCDTLVALDDRVLGKPDNREQAKEMLRLLSGKTHSVYTGVCITDGSRTEKFCCQTAVTFRELSETAVESYVASGESDDKAGAYGIQGLGSVLVKEIDGDYFSVVGLPVSETARVLADFGISGGVIL